MWQKPRSRHHVYLTRKGFVYQLLTLRNGKELDSPFVFPVSTLKSCMHVCSVVSEKSSGTVCSVQNFACHYRPRALLFGSRQVAPSKAGGSKEHVTHIHAMFGWCLAAKSEMCREKRHSSVPLWLQLPQSIRTCVNLPKAEVTTLSRP